MNLRTPRVRASVALLSAFVACFSVASSAKTRDPPARAAASKSTDALINPILFVAQYPVPTDFGAIGSVFANHRGDIEYAGRGGDLYIVYPDGVLRNLTAEAQYGIAGGQLQAGPNAIAVRDPAVHWSGTKAVFSMVTGAPSAQYGDSVYYWQLYEVTGLGEGEAVHVSKVPNQPLNYNNIQPAYDSDGTSSSSPIVRAGRTRCTRPIFRRPPIVTSIRSSTNTKARRRRPGSGSSIRRPASSG